jgi:hypothetical protein
MMHGQRNVNVCHLDGVAAFNDFTHKFHDLQKKNYIRRSKIYYNRDYFQVSTVHYDSQSLLLTD